VQGGIHCGRFIAQQIAAFETEWLAVEGGLQRLDKLHAMAERETKLMMALARSMRLTHQSQYKAETAYTAARSVSNLEPPWDNYGAV
jgi:DNA polymerase III delta subunit